jgi:predicted transcriptional regulator
MTARKFTISLPEDTDGAVREAAEAEGLSVSAWLAKAARHAIAERAALVDGLAAIAEYEAEHGPITTTTEDDAWVQKVLTSAGVGQNQPRTAS